MNKRTLEFKKKFCDKCELSDKRELRMGRPHYCEFIIKNKKDPELRNSHCAVFKPMKSKNKKAKGTAVT